MADEKKRSENRELNENEVDKVSGGKSKFYGDFFPDGLSDGLGRDDNPSEFFPETGNVPDILQPNFQPNPIPMIPNQP